MNIDSNKILIGCDPEIFVSEGKNGPIISAHGLVNGDKWNPEFTEFGALQVDGMALEFNIKPAESLAEFLHNINHTMESLKAKIKAKNPDFEFQIKPVADFKKEYMDTVPPESKALGCTPDFNAWTGKQNDPPNGESLMRTASGHIHVGWTGGADTEPKDSNAHYFDCISVVKQLDCALFLPSSLFDKDKRRRTLYGAMGAFRPKHYGVEYRVLSNAWLNDTRLQAWVYMTTKKAVELLDEGTHLWDDDHLLVSSPYQAYKSLVLTYGIPSLPGYAVTKW